MEKSQGDVLCIRLVNELAQRKLVSVYKIRRDFVESTQNITYIINHCY